MDQNPTTYDAVPYSGMPFTDTHPDRLATIAMLFGMNPPSVPRAGSWKSAAARG